ncbi:MAG: hypothetical protein J0H14_17615 [Alphaproteobacteria bacterium]|nr:hypothetical protein [Alphaproteobacteria bacterium]
MQLVQLTLVAAALVAAFAASALASEADFKLVNRTGYQIDSVYVSPASSKSWGRDIMGRDAVADGESVKITFPHRDAVCHFDIKVKYNDGDEAEWGNVDLCQYETVSLFWDGKQTRAVGE